MQMPSAADKSKLTSAQLADLSTLADGTLDPARRAEVQAWISSSPEVTALYERERRAVEILHRARVSDRAPAALRARIEAQRPRARTRVRQRLSYGGALAASLAVIALALVLILPSGTPGAPSVSQAAALALRGTAAPPPTPDPTAPNEKLGQNVGEVYFPNWSNRFGWRAVGQRIDHIGGRLAVTVYYAWRGRRIAYTIVSAPALAAPAARVTRLSGTELRTLALGGRLVVTWRRQDHTCVLSGNGVPAWMLQRLAAWNATGAAV
jgi:hypothetical protein